MASIQLKIRKTDEEFMKDAEKRILDESNEYCIHKIIFKKIETMDNKNSLFVECSFDDLPEHIKKQIEKPEKVY